MIDDTKKDVVVDETVAVDEKVEEVAVDEKVEEVVEEVHNLSIQDLTQLRNIINIASQRNAFKAEEFEIVGAAYNKLNAFLTAVLPQLEAAKAAKDAEDAGDVKEEITGE